MFGLVCCWPYCARKVARRLAFALPLPPLLSPSLPAPVETTCAGCSSLREPAKHILQAILLVVHKVIHPQVRRVGAVRIIGHRSSSSSSPDANNVFQRPPFPDRGCLFTVTLVRGAPVTVVPGRRWTRIASDTSFTTQRCRAASGSDEAACSSSVVYKVV